MSYLYFVYDFITNNNNNNSRYRFTFSSIKSTAICGAARCYASCERDLNDNACIYSQASTQLNLQYHVVGLEIWNLKGYTNWTEPLSEVRYTINWLKSVREKYYNKIPFDDILLLTYMIFRSPLYTVALCGVCHHRVV